MTIVAEWGNPVDFVKVIVKKTKPAFDGCHYITIDVRDPPLFVLILLALQQGDDLTKYLAIYPADNQIAALTSYLTSVPPLL